MHEPPSFLLRAAFNGSCPASANFFTYISCPQIVTDSSPPQQRASSSQWMKAMQHSKDILPKPVADSETDTRTAENAVSPASGAADQAQGTGTGQAFLSSKGGIGMKVDRDTPLEFITLVRTHIDHLCLVGVLLIAWAQRTRNDFRKMWDACRPQ